MQQFPLKLGKSLETRKEQDAFRSFKLTEGLVDFSSNDYLGFSRKKEIFERALQILEEKGIKFNGAGGSRLLTGNHQLYVDAEEKIASFHKVPAALIFNSGYDTNIGFFSAVPQRGDVIFYDELVHASIRDGIRMNAAEAFKYRHNDLEDLQEKCLRLQKRHSGEVFIVTESVFSMDGDSPDLQTLAKFAEAHNFFLVVDEAHSTGVTGKNGKGLAEELRIENLIFARIITFGKAFGAHGAAILGSQKLKDYLVNFARSLIYTTALPPHSVATILAAYEYFEEKGISEIEKLQGKIKFFISEVKMQELEPYFQASPSAIHCCIIPGNKRVKLVAKQLQKEGFDVRPILSPTVAAGKERLRFCLHSFNSEAEIKSVLSLLSKEIKGVKKGKNG